MLSEIFRKRIHPYTVAAAAYLPLPPDILSTLGLFSTILASFFFAKSYFILYSVCIAANAFFDLADGARSRYLGKASAWGDFLDAAFDRVGENILLCGVLVVYLQIRPESRECPIKVYIAATAITSASFMKSKCDSLGQVCNAGLFKRQERVVIYFMMGLTPSYLLGWLSLLASVAVLNLLQRLRFARQHLRH
jgi:phosphatidylglycerophosphate synthase